MTRTPPPQTPDELERQIAQQREELAHTVDALQAKFDVKAQAKHKAGELRQQPALVGGLAVAALALVALVVWRRRR
jgi:MYXO-CTERM domain-containing protein